MKTLTSKGFVSGTSTEDLFGSTTGTVSPENSTVEITDGEIKGN